MYLPGFDSGSSPRTWWGSWIPSSAHRASGLQFFQFLERVNWRLTTNLKMLKERLCRAWTLLRQNGQKSNVSMCFKQYKHSNSTVTHSCLQLSWYTHLSNAHYTMTCQHFWKHTKEWGNYMRGACSPVGNMQRVLLMPPFSLNNLLNGEYKRIISIWSYNWSMHTSQKCIGLFIMFFIWNNCIGIFCPITRSKSRISAHCAWGIFFFHLSHFFVFM